jgi:hypothetical protein
MQFNPVVVDLSRFDDVQDWDAVKRYGILGVINKTTEGPGLIDHTFAARRRPVRERGIHYGGYHILRPGNPVHQADHFLDVALDVAHPDEVLLALDHEDRRVPLDDVKRFLRRVLDRTGRHAVLCSGFLIKEQLGDGHDPFLARHRLWLSHFSARPVCPPNWGAPWIIQFTGDDQGPLPHNVPGISIPGGIDLNHYGGTAQELGEEWAAGPVMALA